MVPENEQALETFIHLKTIDDQSVELPDQGLAITRKAAELFDLSVGDTVEMYDDDQQNYMERWQSFCKIIWVILSI